VDESLNPALAEAQFCPRCGKHADRDFPRRIVCPHCGYAAYYNPKPVAAVIPLDTDGRVILIRRGFDPGRGRWTFPGGFVDLGESVEEAAHRETEEEIQVAITLGSLVGVYSRPQDRVILIVYRAQTTGSPRPTDEAPEVRAFAPAEIPWDELAFWSTEQALRDALAATG
jgi:ADP-ribose pyrophosphatase YjhB (NUDIX family)